MIVFFNTALLIINQIQIIFRQWNRYLKRFPSAPRSTLTKTLRLMTGNETTHSSMLQHSRRLQGMKARNSVRSGGYAVISSTIIGMRRTRPNLDSSFCLFSWDLHLIWVSRYPCSRRHSHTWNRLYTTRMKLMRRIMGRMGWMGKTEHVLVVRMQQMRGKIGQGTEVVQDRRTQKSYRYDDEHCLLYKMTIGLKQTQGNDTASFYGNSDSPTSQPRMNYHPLRASSSMMV